MKRAQAKWKTFEKQIFNKFKDEFPKSNLKKNDHIIGQHSKVKRQIDISVREKMVGKEVLGIIECKFFNRKIDVKIVDGFIGFLRDVKANFGIIITNKGYTKGAINRAKVEDIKLDIVDFAHLDEYSWDCCQLCDPGPDSVAFIDWYSYNCIAESETLDRIVVGRCDRCNGIHIKCKNCNAITAIYESAYDKIIDCDGGCGLQFKIETTYDHDDVSTDRIEIVKDAG
jgi:predicted helicase